jgi:hypothetical protein
VLGPGAPPFAAAYRGRSFPPEDRPLPLRAVGSFLATRKKPSHGDHEPDQQNLDPRSRRGRKTRSMVFLEARVLRPLPALRRRQVVPRLSEGRQPLLCTSRLDTCLRRAAVRNADDLLVTAYVRAAVYLRWPSATRCKGAAKSIRFPARHAQAFDDYHLSLPRVELDKLNQPDVRRLKPARLPCRHRLLGIETVPISPMLHQLRARGEKRRRSVAHVEFRSRGGSRD